MKLSPFPNSFNELKELFDLIISKINLDGGDFPHIIEIPLLLPWPLPIYWQPTGAGDRGLGTQGSSWVLWYKKKKIGFFYDPYLNFAVPIKLSEAPYLTNLNPLGSLKLPVLFVPPRQGPRLYFYMGSLGDFLAGPATNLCVAIAPFILTHTTSRCILFANQRVYSRHLIFNQRNFF